ncbi:MAG: DUF5011 domain-containing protein, partial [Oscillospiraceae bacterium]
ARPSVAIKGSGNVVVSYGGKYTEKGAEASFMGRDYSSKVVESGEVNTEKLGDYNLCYSFKTPLGITVRARRIVTVEDKKIPQITLNASDEITIDIGSEYIEPGFAAFDNFDGELTDKVSVSGEVDTLTPGEYTISYSVGDSNGNTAVVKRRVTVAESSPLTASLAEFSLSGYFPGAILLETPDAGERYLSGTVFVGDSITQNFAKLGKLPYSNVWYKPSINPLLARDWTLEIDGADSGLTLFEAANKYKPERMIVTMGIGCVGYMPADVFVGHYRSLLEGVEQVSPDTKLIVQSVLPVVHAYDLRGGGAESNDKINIYNYRLAEMCESMGIKFLDTAVIFKNEEGWGPDDCFIDGFHPTRAKNDEIM